MAQKFAFTTVFSESGEVLRDGDRVRRILTEEEVAVVKQQAFEDGQATEIARAAQTQADAERAIASQMQLIFARLHSESEALRADAAQLALAAAKKIAGAALKQYAAETVAELAAEMMSDLRGEPRLSVHCAPEIEEGLAERLNELAAQNGFDGGIIVRGEAGLAGADCRLEWRRGSVARASDEIEARLAELTTKWLDHAPEKAPAEENASPESGAADTHAA